MILHDVPLFVEIKLEDKSVVSFTQIVHREERPDDVCYSCSQKLWIIFVSCNELALPFVRYPLSTRIGVEPPCESVLAHWIIGTGLSRYHRGCST